MCQYMLCSSVQVTSCFTSLLSSAQYHNFFWAVQNLWFLVIWTVFWQSFKWIWSYTPYPPFVIELIFNFRKRYKWFRHTYTYDKLCLGILNKTNKYKTYRARQYVWVFHSWTKLTKESLVVIWLKQSGLCVQKNVKFWFYLMHSSGFNWL